MLLSQNFNSSVMNRSENQAPCVHSVEHWPSVKDTRVSSPASLAEVPKKQILLN